MISRRGKGALWTLILVVLAGIIVPFLIWGEHFDEILNLEGAQRWMQGYGDWAWAAGIVLLMSDIVLPIPSTVVMSALGWMYGWWLGGLIAASGSFLSGMAAYGLCRWLGRSAAKWIAGEEGLRQGEALFAQKGGWLVALSRWAPVLPEAVACLAGMMQMRWSTFVLALACGSLPLGFTFALIGQLGHSSPTWAIILSAILPLILWSCAAKWWRK
ncbi:putative membrane protein YdjX (TVP38/TMEM64 family) [Prosthecobacter fusiformis]|uniref:Putative membrane protein YdjX (TVP38/TMEM64 family) n=1 Tax=Prosthecobacter fusiformis TaxID=48464 RepID=A0A4V3FE02_9BACT|nr:VTT domain-containing protein [Prosthecobacter fusiformis]TDU63130.1 putative membrane protein YdjX (TVP38/TMEM64 family) [Prosthecobacter fusiformis]